jgi:hypothetical protein
MPTRQYQSRQLGSISEPRLAGIYTSDYDFDPNEAKVPDYLRRKWHPTDLLPESLSEPLAGFRDKLQTAGSKLGIGPKTYREGQTGIGPDETMGTVQKLLNRWELPLVGGAGDFARSEIEEEALGPVGKMASVAAKPLAAAGKGLFGKGLASLGGIIPTTGYRRDVLRTGDILNRRFQLDTPDLERTMRLLESSGPSGLITKYTDKVAADPSGQTKFQELLDLAESNAPEEDITDEMARRMAITGNSPVPPRRGSFPGLSPTDTPTPTGGTHKTREELAGGPVIDLGRFGFGGINSKRATEGPSGRFMEKGTPGSYNYDSTPSAFVESDRSSSREEAQTKIMELLGGDTPVAHRIEGGGTAQALLPQSFVGWPYDSFTLDRLRTPEIANQLAAEQARDVFGAVTDRHTGQFMFDPTAQKMAGVDKGYGDLTTYNLRGQLMPPDSMLSNAGGRANSIMMYDTLTKEGMYKGLVDPDSFQRVAALGLQVPESDWRRVLDPVMENNFITSQADKDAAIRNYMQSIQGMPAHLDRYYRNFVKP